MPDQAPMLYALWNPGAKDYDRYDHDFDEHGEDAHEACGDVVIYTEEQLATEYVMGRCNEARLLRVRLTPEILL